LSAKKERKPEVLRFVEEERGGVTTSQVADAFEMEIHNARNQLCRYWKAGLLYRKKLSRKTKQRAYRIAEKEIDRMKWLENSNQSFSAGRIMRTKKTGSCEYPHYCG